MTGVTPSLIQPSFPIGCWRTRGGRCSHVRRSHLNSSPTDGSDPSRSRSMKEDFEKLDTRISRQNIPSPAKDAPSGVVGNARLTGTLGAALFVLLAIEGVTILRVKELISAHVFVGMLIVPPVVVKTATTMYRFTRYYLRDPNYSHKGPPPTLLRIVGPLVVVTSIAVLATGIG